MTKAKVCECCGHPLPPMEVLLDLTRMQQRMFVTIKKAGRAGIDADTLLDFLYANANAPDRCILSVMKHAMQPKLQKHGLQLKVRTGPGALWRLEAI